MKFAPAEVGPYRLDRNPAPDTILLDADWARVVRHRVDSPRVIGFPADSFTILCCIEGEIGVSYPGHSFNLESGHTCLIPATVTAMHFTGRGSVISITA